MGKNARDIALEIGEKMFEIMSGHGLTRDEQYEVMLYIADAALYVIVNYKKAGED